MTEGGSTLKLKMPLARFRIAAAFGPRRPRGSPRIKVPIRTSEKRGWGYPFPALCSGAVEPRHLAWLFCENRAPLYPPRLLLGESGKARGELFVLFVEKMGGGPLPHSPTTQHVAIRRLDAHLKSALARMERAP